MPAPKRPRRRRDPAPPTDLREACLAAAHAVIAEEGLEGLSLRDVSRRLGVSHQAPYKHFANRDDLLAAVMLRSFERFAQALDDRPPTDDPAEDMAAMGRAYLRFARENPLEYRLMFGTPWPEGPGSAGLAAGARHAFDLLREALGRRGAKSSGADPDLDALFVWAVVHGLAGILNGETLGRLGLPRGVAGRAAAHALDRIGDALGGGRKATSR